MKNVLKQIICMLAAAAVCAGAASAAPNPPQTTPVHFHFDVNLAELAAHNGTLQGSGWGTAIRAGVSWNHIDNTFTYRSIRTSFDGMGSPYWNDSYWDDDLDYCYDDDFPDGQVARINLGFSYQHLSINDTGFPYAAQGVGFNTGFSLRSTPQLTEYGRIAYVPTLTANNGVNQQFSRQQYDFGVRYKPSVTKGFFIEGGYFEDVLQGKNGGGGIYNYGPYLGVGSRF